MPDHSHLTLYNVMNPLKLETKTVFRGRKRLQATDFAFTVIAGKRHGVSLEFKKKQIFNLVDDYL